MTKKTIIISAVILLVVIVIGGLFFYQQSQPKSLGQITLGWNIWPGNLPYLVAYDQGYFKQEGLDATMVKEKDYGTMLDDLVANKFDFSGDIALVDVVEKVSKGSKLKVILATDYSNGADGIVAKKEIKNISEFKGKKVAAEEGTLGDYLLYDALKKNNLSFSDIQEINLSAQEAAKAFIRGEVDAAVTYEPDYSQAVKDGNGWRIFTSADSPGLIIDVLTFSGDFATENPARVSAVVRAYFKAMDFIAKNPNQAYAIGAKYFKITPYEFKEQYSGIKQMGLNDNQKIMSYGTSVDSLHGSAEEAVDFLQIIGKLKSEVDSTEIIDPRFVRELTQ